MKEHSLSNSDSGTILVPLSGIKTQTKYLVYATRDPTALDPFS